MSSVERRSEFSNHAAFRVLLLSAAAVNKTPRAQLCSSLRLLGPKVLWGPPWSKLGPPSTVLPHYTIVSL